MTIAQYISKLDAKIAELKSGKWLELAALDAKDDMSKRIFTKNENASGKTFQYALVTKKKKQQKGHQSSRVNWIDTGDLQRDFNNNGKISKDGLFSFKIDLKRDRNVKIKEKIDKRYSFVFKIRASEKNVFLKSARTNFKLLMAK